MSDKKSTDKSSDKKSTDKSSDKKSTDQSSDGKSTDQSSDGKSIGREFLRRSMDRFFPDPNEKTDPLPGFVRCCASFLGAATWGVILLVYLVATPVITTTSGATKIFLTYQDTPWAISWTTSLFLATAVSSAMFSVLIGVSIKNGTLLNFYFWGLGITLVVTKLISFAFGGL